jgi:para-nitrobenzyl esterase
MGWKDVAVGAATALLSLVAGGVAHAQVTRATPGQPEARTALDLMPAKAKLAVTTPAFKDGGDIPFENTQYRTNTFPGLTWSKGPGRTRTKSYAIIMQDNSLLLRSAPILHWTMFNIPAGVTRLDAGMAPDALPAGSAYGPNFKGAARPYTGPRTPPNMKDTYHFQVFALDTTLPAEAGSDYAVLTKAMDGHVLASGEVVGVGQADPNAPPRPAPPRPSN